MTIVRAVVAAALLGAAAEAAACGLLATQALSTTLSDGFVAAPTHLVFDCRIEACRQLAQAELDRMRGGFFDETSLKISIGIDRIVAIGNELVAVTRLTIPDLTQAPSFGAAPGQPASASGAPVSVPTIVIQNGPGNSMTETLLPAALTLIQNSFDDQQIRNMTQLNITVADSISRVRLNWPRRCSNRCNVPCADVNL